MRCDTVKTDLIKFHNVPPLEEEVIYCSSIKVVEEEVNKNVHCSVSSILYLLQKSIVESRNVGSRLVFVGGFSAISIPRLVTEKDV